MTQEVNWQEIAQALGQRLNYVISYCKPNMNAGMMNMETHEYTSAVDYIADGLEMLPGIKVDREMLGLSQAGRKKLIKQRKEIL